LAQTPQPGLVAVVVVETTTLAAVLAFWAKALTGRQGWQAEAPRKKSLAKVALAAAMVPTPRAVGCMAVVVVVTPALAVAVQSASFGVRGVRSHQQIQVTCNGTLYSYH
jgi:hypothetical protein